MANTVAIVAESGGGKSSSLGEIPSLGIKGVNPERTFLINVNGKPLPYRGSKSLYKHVPVGKPPAEGNYFVSKDPKMIEKVISYIGENRSEEFDNVIIDDFQYTMADTYMTEALSVGFTKFAKIGHYTYRMLTAGIDLPPHMNFVILTHSEQTDTGFKMKTSGKMLDQHITLEGLFTVVLYLKSEYDRKTDERKKYFVTNDDGVYPAKSPVGMFEQTYILNDLGNVLETMENYY